MGINVERKKIGLVADQNENCDLSLNPCCGGSNTAQPGFVVTSKKLYVNMNDLSSECVTVPDGTCCGSGTVSSDYESLNIQLVKRKILVPINAIKSTSCSDVECSPCREPIPFPCTPEQDTLPPYLYTFKPTQYGFMDTVRMARINDTDWVDPLNPQYRFTIAAPCVNYYRRSGYSGSTDDGTRSLNVNSDLDANNVLTGDFFPVYSHPGPIIESQGLPIDEDDSFPDVYRLNMSGRDPSDSVEVFRVPNENLEPSLYLHYSFRLTLVGLLGSQVGTIWRSNNRWYIQSLFSLFGGATRIVNAGELDGVLFDNSPEFYDGLDITNIRTNIRMFLGSSIFSPIVNKTLLLEEDTSTPWTYATSPFFYTSEYGFSSPAYEFLDTDGLTPTFERSIIPLSGGLFVWDQKMYNGSTLVGSFNPVGVPFIDIEGFRWQNYKVRYDGVDYVPTSKHYDGANARYWLIFDIPFFGRTLSIKVYN